MLRSSVLTQMELIQWPNCYRLTLNKKQVLNVLYSISNTGFHRRRYAQSRMNAAKIVVGKMQGTEGSAAFMFSSFFENAFVRRVNLRSCMRTVKFWRSTCEVDILCDSGDPITGMGIASITSEGRPVPAYINRCMAGPARECYFPYWKNHSPQMGEFLP